MTAPALAALLTILALVLAGAAAAYATCAPIAEPLAAFFATRLLVAAAAALHPGVIKAFVLQRLLGLALLAAIVWS